MYLYIIASMYVFMHMYSCVYVHVCIYACIYVCILCKHALIYICRNS